MDQNDQIILGTEPLLETDETLLLEIASAFRGIERKKELEGKITFNPRSCLIYSLSPAIGDPSQLPERPRGDFYLFVIPYTLHPNARDQYYKEVTLFIEIITAGITAYDLFPKAITGETAEAKIYTLAPNLRFQEAKGVTGETRRQLRFHELRPTIMAFGEGESTFYWVLKASKKQQGVVPETKYALAVLQVPSDVQAIEATISYEVVKARKFLDVWKSVYGETQPCTVRWSLQDAPAFFKAPEKELSTGQQNFLAQNSSSTRSSTKVLKLVYCYAHTDHIYRQQLENHLSNVTRRYHLQVWFDRQINPGDQWQTVLEEHLDTADLILLLISSDFMSSNYCYNREMQRVLERHAKGEAKVIPILLRPVYWANAPFSELQMLPTDAQPIQSWNDPDEAFYDVVKGIEKVIQDLLKAFR